MRLLLLLLLLLLVGTGTYGATKDRAYVILM